MMYYSQKRFLFNYLLCYSTGSCTCGMGKFVFFTEHENILYMTSPTCFQSNVPRHIAEKLQRWAIRLSEFIFLVEHILGENNTWSDMLTRWEDRVMFAPHCWLSGHSVYTITCNIIKYMVYYDTFNTNVKEFVQGCLVYILSENRQNVLFPLDPQFHAEIFAELLHFDYLYVGESVDGKR